MRYHHPEINPYLFGPEEQFSISLNFKDTVNIVKLFAVDRALRTDKSLLVIDVSEGVFIKSTSADWSYLLAGIVENSQTFGFDLQIIDESRWSAITRSHKAPNQSFGDESLAVWKIGF